MFKSCVLSAQYQSTWLVYCQSRENSTRGKNSTCFPTQRLKPLLWCSILRKQVTVCFPFVRIKQPSSRLTLAALRQGQKNTARLVAQIQLAVGQLMGTWAATRGLIFHLRKPLPVSTYMHIHVDKNSVYRRFAVASHTSNMGWEPWGSLEDV